MVATVKILSQCAFMAGVLPYMELYIIPNSPALSFLTQTSSLGVPRATALIIFVHLAAGFWIAVWGLMVGR